MTEDESGSTRACDLLSATHDFEASQLLYRLAFANATRRASRANQSAERGGDVERMARSFDAAVEAVVLFQASAEAWINLLFESHGLHAHGGGWRARWKGIGHVAASDGRPRRSIRSEYGALLDDVNAIRNFMLHGDTDSRERFARQFGGRAIHDVLSGDFVDLLFQRAEGMWAEAKTITGHETPFSDGAWVAWDEAH